MASLKKIIEYLDDLLEINKFSDSSTNGLQVDSGNDNIESIALAVDSGLSVIEAAKNSQLLIVHHGFFWGGIRSIDSALSKKLSCLYTNQCSLAAYHLPLDAHPEVGNNFELARLLGLVKLKSYFNFDGQNIGVIGEFEKSLDFKTIEAKLKPVSEGAPIFSWNFGKQAIKTVGIVTGSGSSALDACAKANLDLFISGEPKQEAYHTAKDLKLNAIFAGHYGTETFGVKALGRKLSEKFNVKVNFIEQPTGV